MQAHERISAALRAANDSGRGGVIDLRAIPNADPAMSPLEIWCNEAQERYVLAIAHERLAEFEAICTNPEPPDFANTVEALERHGLLLDRVAAMAWRLVNPKR